MHPRVPFVGIGGLVVDRLEEPIIVGPVAGPEPFAAAVARVNAVAAVTFGSLRPALDPTVLVVPFGAVVTEVTLVQKDFPVTARHSLAVRVKKEVEIGRVLAEGCCKIAVAVAFQTARSFHRALPIGVGDFPLFL